MHTTLNRREEYRLKVVNNILEAPITLVSDMIIAKRIPDEDKKRGAKTDEYQIIALNLYGNKTNLTKALKKNSVINFELVNGDNHRNTIYRINSLKNFNIKETKGKRTTRYSIVRNKDILLNASEILYPTVVLPESKANELKQTIFELVRESVSVPLFPDLTNPFDLAKQLAVTEEKATEVLSGLLTGLKQKNKLGKLEEITLDGIKKYFEWVDYIYLCLKNDGHIEKLDVLKLNNLGDDGILAYEITVKEEIIRKYVSNGLKNGIISISNEKNHTNHFTTFDSYNERYSKIFKDIVDIIYPPHHKNGDIRQSTIDETSKLKRVPYSSQINAVEAMIKSLNLQKRVNLVGTPGVGKTLTMLTAAYKDALDLNKPLKALVLSPDHLIETSWEEEADVTFKGIADYHHIKSINDLIHYEKEGYLDDNQHRIFILGQNAAKNGYANAPRAIWTKSIWRRVPSHFKCPDCGEVITQRKLDRERNVYVEIPAEFDFFAREKQRNRSCKKCKAILWGPNNKKSSSFKKFYGAKDDNVFPFMYCDLGFIPRDLRAIERARDEALKEHNEKKTKYTKSRLENLRKARLTLKGELKEKRQVSPYKVPVSFYIKKKLKHRFSHLIIDEVHNFQNDGTSRVTALSNLIPSVSRIISGTGTMMNGYAKSRFLNDFMLFPEKMKKNGFNYGDESKYQVTFGVSEDRWMLVDGKKKKIAPKSKPGISTVIFPLFLQDSTVFLDLDDIEENLPSQTEHPISIDMPNELKEGKEELESAVRAATKGDRQMVKGIMPTLYSYLDSPTVPKEVKDIDGNVVYTTRPISNHDDAKMNALINIVRNEKMDGRRSIVYTHYTSDGINSYIQQQLQREGFRVTVLNKEDEYSISFDGTKKRVQKDKREWYIKEEVAKGADVLVTNPDLIKEGTNLIDFSNLIHYQMCYITYTIRQANGRIRRIGQTQHCKIYYLYYNNSFQEDVTKLMATKIVASEAIEGKFNSKGLKAITDTRTPEEELADKFIATMNI